MKSNIYRGSNNVDRLYNDKSTLFLDSKELKDIKHKLKGLEYKTYYLYEDCDKVLLYRNNIPDIKLYRIDCDKELKHQNILGTILSLGIDSAYIGDIVKLNDNFYIFVLESMSRYLIDNLDEIRGIKIKLIEDNSAIFENYKRKYEDISLIVSSERLDSIISSLCNISRKMADTLISNKNVLLNYDVALKNTYILKENDIFSIRRVGKFKYVGILKNTRKDKLIVKVLKYI